MTTISFIVGSTRQGRFSEKAAEWVRANLSQRPDLQVKVLDRLWWMNALKVARGAN